MINIGHFKNFLYKLLPKEKTGEIIIYSYSNPSMEVESSSSIPACDQGFSEISKKKLRRSISYTSSQPMENILFFLQQEL